MRVIALGTDVSEWNVFTCMLEQGSSFVRKFDNWKKSRALVLLVFLF